MITTEYRPRVIDALLSRKLRGKGAVLIEGAKWCGKTSTAEQQAKSTLYLSDPKLRDQYHLFVDTNPEMILDGDTPRLIDEWQQIPKLWDHIRFEVDHRSGMGHFILTGSAVPARRDEIVHSGTGRFAWLIMRPMSLWESGDSNGKVSLRELFNSPDKIAATSDIDLRRIAFLTCRGGWPQAALMNDDEEIALDQAIDYYDAVVHSDIQRVDNVERDTERVKRLMRSYARYQGSQASFAEIYKDMVANEKSGMDENTISSYLNALRHIFVVEDMRAWNPNLRSKTAIRSTDTRYFVDPSIATASLGLGPDNLMNDLETFGLLFETLCVRDLRVFSQLLDGEVYHYRDKSGLECDAVVHLRNGSYGLIEIKLGGDKRIDEASKTLHALAAKIDTTRMKNPAFMMVLTAAGNFAYRRTDGVYVVPIGCLKD
jgi:predicted AAA+ superfamily ATPase